MERIRSTIGKGRAALAEVAGRDSIAAAVAAARSGSFDVIVPTVAYTGTEFGDWEVVLANARSLSERMEDLPGVKVADETVLLGSPRWWHACAGRFAGEIQSRYGFSATCVACHMYLHAARIPFARAVGAVSIIAGERLAHDGTVKLNQLKGVLEAYAQVAGSHGIAMELPLEEMSEGSRVEGLVGPWAESGRQMSCALEANYRGVDGDFTFAQERLESYLEEFLVPFTSRVLARLGDGSGAPAYAAIAREIIAERSNA